MDFPYELQRLRLKKDFNIIVELEGLVALLSFNMENPI